MEAVRSMGCDPHRSGDVVGDILLPGVTLYLVIHKISDLP
jgi:hypothetical protein